MKIIKNTFLPLLALLLISCGDNTETPIISEVTSIEIDKSSVSIHSTDSDVTLNAMVNYSDGSSADASNGVTWGNTDYSVLNMLEGKVSAYLNGGEANVTIGYGDFSDSIKVEIIELTDVMISSDPITTTGLHTIEAKGNFKNGDTNITLVNNVKWYGDNDAVLSVDENKIWTIEVNSGDTNLTLSVFDINETIIYSID